MTTVDPVRFPLIVRKEVEKRKKYHLVSLTRIL